LAIALGAAGGALAASGAAVLIWNESRYADIERARRRLMQNPPERSVESQEDLNQAIAFARALERSDTELESLQRTAIVGLTMVGAGGALIAGGGAVYFMQSRDAVVSVGLRRIGLTVAF
jgi:hypothetical protein